MLISHKYKHSSLLIHGTQTLYNKYPKDLQLVVRKHAFSNHGVSFKYYNFKYSFRETNEVRYERDKEGSMLFSKLKFSGHQSSKHKTT